MKKILSFLLVMCFMCQMEAMDGKLGCLIGPPYRVPAEMETVYQDAFFKVFSKNNIRYVAQQGTTACSKLANYSLRGARWTAHTAYEHPVAASCFVFTTIGVGYAFYKLPSRRSLLNMQGTIGDAVDDSGKRIEDGARETAGEVVTELGEVIDGIDSSVGTARKNLGETETILDNLATEREILKTILNDANRELATAQEEEVKWLENLQKRIGDKIRELDGIAGRIKAFETGDGAIINEALKYIDEGDELSAAWNEYQEKQVRLASLVQEAYGLSESIECSSADENKGK